MSALSHPTCLVHTWIFFFLKVHFSKMPNLNIFDPHLSPKPFPHLPADTALLISPSHFPLTLALAALCGKKICAVNTVWHFLTFHELITLQIIKHVHICNKRRQNGCQRAWLMTSLRLDLMRFSPPWAGARCHCVCNHAFSPFHQITPTRCLKKRMGKLMTTMKYLHFSRAGKKQWTRDVTTSIIWWY